MRKLVLLALIVSLSGIAWAGGGQESSKGPVTLTWWALDFNKGRDAELAKKYMAAFPEREGRDPDQRRPGAPGQGPGGAAVGLRAGHRRHPGRLEHPLREHRTGAGTGRLRRQVLGGEEGRLLACQLVVDGLQRQGLRRALPRRVPRFHLQHQTLRPGRSRREAGSEDLEGAGRQRAKAHPHRRRQADLGLRDLRRRRDRQHDLQPAAGDLGQRRRRALGGLQEGADQRAAGRGGRAVLHGFLHQAQDFSRVDPAERRQPEPRPLHPGGRLPVPERLLRHPVARGPTRT